MSRIDKLVRQAVEEGFYQQTKDQEAISRVRELHRQREALSPLTELSIQVCVHCSIEYPCPTIEAIDGEQ